MLYRKPEAQAFAPADAKAIMHKLIRIAISLIMGPGEHVGYAFHDSSGIFMS